MGPTPSETGSDSGAVGDSGSVALAGSSDSAWPDANTGAGLDYSLVSEVRFWSVVSFSAAGPSSGSGAGFGVGSDSA